MLKRARLLCYLMLCISRAVLSVVLGAWSVRFVGWADWVDCRCFLSFVFLGVARRLELSPCNTLNSCTKLMTRTLPRVGSLALALPSTPTAVFVPTTPQQKRLNQSDSSRCVNVFVDTAVFTLLVHTANCTYTSTC